MGDGGRGSGRGRGGGEGEGVGVGAGGRELLVVELSHRPQVTEQRGLP